MGINRAPIKFLTFGFLAPPIGALYFYVSAKDKVHFAALGMAFQIIFLGGQIEPSLLQPTLHNVGWHLK